MDFEATRLQRQQALDEKRKRLEEMKKAKKERTEIEEQVNSTTNIESKIEVDNILNNLLPVPSSSIEINTNDNNIESNNNNNNESILSREEINELKQKKLTTVKNIGSVQIFPSRIETYEKDCQTDDVDICNGNDNSIDDEYDNKNNELLQNSPQKISHIRPRSSSYNKIGSTPFKGKNPPSPNNDNDGGGLNLFGSSQSSHLILLTNEEKEVIINSTSFKSFLNKSSRYIERTLSMNSIAGSDVMRDYLTDGLNGNSVFSSKKTLTLLSVVEDETIGKRPVMDINFSPHFPELFLAAYGSEIIPNKQNKSLSSSLHKNENEFPGLICIWSTVHKTRPEFKFTASSPVLTARFHDQDPHLIVGCCYSGQILSWDMRAKSLPVQQSSVSGKGHKHPVYSMCIIGSGTSPSELISISTDGVLCNWDLTRLTEPISVSPIQYKSTTTDATTVPMTISSMAYSIGESSKEVIFGSGSGAILHTSLPFRSHDTAQQINAHSGLITAMHMNPSQNKTYKNLLLTSSFDWSVKLWNLKISPNQPIMEFLTQSYDYVVDVQWCPSYPSIFATITSEGELTIWDINKSTTIPIETINIIKNDNNNNNNNNKSSGNNAVNNNLLSNVNNIGALNKCKWSEDSKTLIIGDSKGSIHIISVHESIFKSLTNRVGLDLQNNSTVRNILTSSSNNNNNNNEIDEFNNSSNDINNKE